MPSLTVTSPIVFHRGATHTRHICNLCKKNKWCKTDMDGGTHTKGQVCVPPSMSVFIVYFSSSMTHNQFKPRFYCYCSPTLKITLSLCTVSAPHMYCSFGILLLICTFHLKPLNQVYQCFVIVMITFPLNNLTQCNFITQITNF